MTQAEALDILKLGHNVYLTGAAGSGKTFLINQYVEWLRTHKVGVGITASTGIAATHINGRTIHSWAGIGIEDKLSSKHLYSLLNSTKFQNRFAKTKVLIIDEVSMLHAVRLDLVDQVCRAFKNGQEPFGGIQVILVGDFFQLPPVARAGEDNSFIHTSRAWEDMAIKICYLTEQHRQQDDKFLQILNDIRAGVISNDSQSLIKSTYNQKLASKITPTKLYTVNVDVDAINSFQLEKIKDEPHLYQMISKGEKDLVTALKKGCLAPESLLLKKGAVVMFVKNNFEKGYVNGTMGEVVDFDDSDYPIVRITNGELITPAPASWAIEDDEFILAEICQLPLRLAWAITIHKSQGMSLDCVEVDLSKAFTYGMGYVALSRVRTLAGLRLLGLNDLALQVNPEVIDLYSQFFETSNSIVKDLKKLGKRKKTSDQKQFLEKIKQ